MCVPVFRAAYMLGRASVVRKFDSHRNSECAAENPEIFNDSMMMNELA
jgi:hypothetical protein